LKQEVDILVPAAMESQINHGNIDDIHSRVKIIVEGANGPIAQEADVLLNQKGIYILPDLLANAGGFICTYFEQVQGNMNYYWRREEVLGKLDVQLTDAYLSIMDHAKNYQVSMREAAYRIAVDRVVRACQERGWI
jgi:glutamate dehydrogenase (NAD(P)+)